MEQSVKTISDYKEILQRRKWSLILTALAVFSIVALITFMIPPIYRSTSTILIEEQEIPRDFVISAVTSFAEQRIQTINQRIMSTSKLLEIINRFNLYADLREKWTTEEIIEKMRKKDIKFEMINAEIMDRRTGRPTAAAIAFSLSYKGKDPVKVQQVANILASLYLEENLKSREQQAKGASRFLEEELKAVRDSLADLDAKIAPFKEKHINALPELLQVNFQTLERIEWDIGRLNDELRSYKDKEGYLQTQLATTPPDMADQDRALLKELKARLVQLESKFSHQYPDVKKTKIEIADLEKRLSSRPVGGSGSPAKAPEKAIDRPDNPAYITLASQLASTQADIESVKRQILELKQRREIYRRNIEASPRVEEKFKTLIAERSNMQNKYDDLMRKLMESKVSYGLEKEQMAERFTLVDPAQMPEKPIIPNVPVFLLVGVFLGISAGVGAMVLREMNDLSVRAAEDLAAITPLPVLASIPVIVNWKETEQRKTRRRLAAVAVILFILVAVSVFHFFIMDLDLFWIKLSKKLMI